MQRSAGVSWRVRAPGHTSGAQGEEGRTAGRGTVLFVSLPTAMGGSSRSLATVLGHLEGRYERVLAVPKDAWLADLVLERGTVDRVLHVPGLEWPRPWRVIAMLRIARWVWGNRGAVVAIHANGLAELNLAAGAAVLTRKPLVVWVHDWQITPWARRLVPIISWATRATLVPVSVSGAVDLRRCGVTRRARVVVVENPIDGLDVGGRTLAPNEAAEFVVGFLGSDSRYKGFHLLPAIADALSDLPMRILVFANQTGQDDRTWELLDDMASVELARPCTDVRAAYERCDVVVCPSLAESFGRVAAEAMLNGIPVVASDLPALREVLGGAGLLVDVEDTAGFADAVRRLYRSPVLREELSQRGKHRAQHYSPERIVAGLVALYEG